MIDIHTHILPGVDDGSPDLPTTLAMIRMAADDGTTAMVATPHFDFRYRFDAEQCRRELEALSSACAAVSLHLGCELHLTPENIDCVVDSPGDYTLNGRDCVLLELPDSLNPAALESALERLLRAGCRPVIAHPERNAYLQRHPNYSRELVHNGCYLQITAQAMLGSFGAAAARAAQSFLRRSLVHFVASDAHAAERRRPLLCSAYRYAALQYGDSAAHILFHENPLAALNGAEIQAVPAGPRALFATVFSFVHASNHRVSNASNLP